MWRRAPPVRFGGRHNGGVAGIGYGCAFLLAFVFVRAAVAKLNQPAATAAAFAAMGLPAPGVLRVAVPVVELALAVTLVAAPAAGGVAGLVLLAAFTTLLGRELARGSTTGCGCFGGTARPVSAADLARNCVLAALAVVAAVATWR